MTNGIGPTSQRPDGVKMTSEVYTVSRHGVVSPPRATVSMPYNYEPALEDLSTQHAPCACPVHREADALQ
ncbi:hypothetical protein ACFV7R_43920 [Streptomyces sp. NPDC059866]|uniref:hypothetical protein n=1 Tax=Streptomyces sp. NPDC059866 TaxID=3346978 RepID=UPI003661887C